MNIASLTVELSTTCNSAAVCRLVSRTTRDLDIFLTVLSAYSMTMVLALSSVFNEVCPLDYLREVMLRILFVLLLLAEEDVITELHCFVIFLQPLFIVAFV